MKDEQTVYVYTGDGRGIPGLPHETTKAEAEQLGLLESLQAAIAAGIYKPRKGPTKGQTEEA